jgi:DNA polymerase I-like protein with 3'-5' exonuclease and polymerase domains
VIKPNDPNNVIVEIDYSTLEVVIGACLHGDPTMAEYLLTGFDFHKATARDCFFMEDIPKPLRQLAKVANFSLIYGDFYVAIAEKMWKAVKELTLQNSKIDGSAVLSHLATKGIKRLGTEHDSGIDTFTGHIKNVCDRFWRERFPVFAKWRNDTWNDYVRKGYLYTKTGFRILGVYRRNEILNVETQGCAFHCLLQSVIDITRKLGQTRMRSRLFCQIHDSLLAEVPRQELDDYIAMATYTMTEGIRARWNWVKLPLSTEVEVGESWASKKPYHKT